MGDHVGVQSFSRQDRTRFRAKVGRCLDALAVMLADGTWGTGDEDRPPSFAP